MSLLNNEILSTPARLNADLSFTGRGVTLALVDSGFYPIEDLIKPTNRIRAWVDANEAPVRVIRFARNEIPTWPGYDDNSARHWHGLMTSCVAAGNGFLSEGKYRGLASEAEIILVRVTREGGGIPNENIVRALQWLHASIEDYKLRVVSLSVSGDPYPRLLGNPIDEAVTALAKAGVIVVAAAGNDGVRRLTPPATAPEALTIGGVDDKNSFDPREVEIWHSNYGESNRKLPKPELVAPSIRVAAPLLPNSEMTARAKKWFTESDEKNIAAQNLISPHYQQVEGTSFAAPMVAGTVACMLQAHPSLTPFEVRRILIATATRVPDADDARQGAGALHAGAAVRAALEAKQRASVSQLKSPHLKAAHVLFIYRDSRAKRVQVRGEWDNWQNDADAQQIEDGVWIVEIPKPASGFYAYKFLIDETIWIDDPDNPTRRTNAYGEYDSVLVVS